VMVWQIWLDLPLVVRCLFLFLLGLGVGGQINWGIYRLAWNCRPISPWSPAPPGAEPRTWRDRLPLLGWVWLRRESNIHGSGFWVRPLLIELASGAVFAGMYWWEVDQLALFPRLRGLAWAPETLQGMAHRQYVTHMILFALMMAATFIDFDEKTIPDGVTIPGTLIGLLLAGMWPDIGLPTAERVDWTTFRLESLRALPTPWPDALHGWQGWLVAVAIYTGWGLALMDKLTTLRRGWTKGAIYLVVSIHRRRSWLPLIPLLAVGFAYLTLVWWWGGPRWESLLNAMLGLGFGGLVIWGVRIAGWLGLGIEAMGFGDVTLMAMIGTFLGWQAAVLVFFLSPMMAVIVAILQWAFTGSHYIAFGPYLCLAAATLVVAWDRLWTHWAQPIFSLGPVIPVVIGFCLVLMALMLRFWRLFRERVLNLHY
jgi:leader peptidase (prepilin peptidase) / N-methyltransferase